MKNKKFLVPFRVVVTICAALGWWGVLYPELTMTPDTYRIVYEETACEEAVYLQNDEMQELMELAGTSEWDFDNNIYETVLGAKPGQIRFRSRLFRNVTALYEQERGINDSGK